MSFSLDGPLEAVTGFLRDVATDDEERREEESGHEGAAHEDGLEGDDWSRGAEGRGNGWVSSLVRPL